MQRLEEAYDAYRNALILVPGDQDAKHNLELTLLMLNQRDNPQDPNNPDAGAGDAATGPGNASARAGHTRPRRRHTAAGRRHARRRRHGTPQPGRGRHRPGTPQPGQGTPSPQDAAALQRALEEALRGINEDLTFEEAIGILDLLRQQQQRQIAPGGGGSEPDY